MYLPHVEFRDAVLSDAEQLEKIESRCFPETYWDKAEFEEYIESAWTRVVERNGEVAGFVILEMHPDYGYIATVDVDPDARRNGYANNLIEQAEIEVKRRGFKFMRLHVAVDNPAYKLYYERGYLVLEYCHDFYSKGQHALEMQKVL